MFGIKVKSKKNSITNTQIWIRWNKKGNRMSLYMHCAANIILIHSYKKFTKLKKASKNNFWIYLFLLLMQVRLTNIVLWLHQTNTQKYKQN